MLEYVYNENTKELLFSREAFIDPLETEKKGENVYMLSANSTFKEPLETKEKHAICFIEDEWKYVEDNRGTLYYPKDADYNTSPIEMKELGSLPEGYLLERPEKTQEMKENDVRNIRDAYLVSYVDKIVSNPLRWSEMSEEEQEVYKNYRQYLLNYPQSSETWYENNPLTFEEWKQTL